MANTYLKTFFRQIKCIFTAKRKRFILIILLNMIASALIPLILTLIPKKGIELILVDASKIEVIRTIGFLCLGLLGAMLISTVAIEIERWCFTGLRINQFRDVVNKQLNVKYEKLEESNYMDYVDESTKALAGNNIGFEMVYHDLYSLLPQVLGAIIYTVILFMFSYLLAITALLCGIIALVINTKLAKYYSKQESIEANAYKQMRYFQNISYDFSYGKDIRVYSLQDKLKNDLKNKSINYLNVLKKMYNKEFSLGIIELFFLFLQDLAAYVLIALAYFDSRINIADVSFYVGLVIALSTALRLASSYYTSMVQNLRLSKIYFDYIDNNSLAEENKGRASLPKEETLEIIFDNVSFKYPNTDRYIIRNLNLKISKKEKLAIVGINGAGKTTICKLLVGLFTPTSGRILINGIDNREFSKKALAEMFAMVFQDVNIYACSILENVIGDDESNIEFGKECLRKVGLEEKIKSLPNGYDTEMLKVLEEDGVELSGGQNQKIAIARALYKDANMVILDEPTSALDALSEAEIYSSFDDLVKSKTAIYISHRLSSTKFCDNIALFTSDGLVEYGNHEELMNKKGLYYQMFMTQGKYYKEGCSNEE